MPLKLSFGLFRNHSLHVWNITVSRVDHFISSLLVLFSPGIRPIKFHRVSSGCLFFLHRCTHFLAKVHCVDSWMNTFFFPSTSHSNAIGIDFWPIGFKRIYRILWNFGSHAKCFVYCTRMQRRYIELIDFSKMFERR